MKKTFIISSLIVTTLATPSFATPTELDKKTVASKAYVDTKQDIIETDLVTFHEPEEQIDYDVPALVSFGTGTNNADGVLGNKIGVLSMNENHGSLNAYEFLDLLDDEESGYLDNFVPTVRAVSFQLRYMWDVIQPFAWNVSYPNLINAYSTTFDRTSTHVDGNWPYNTQTNLVQAGALVNSLALKQNKIDAGTSGNVVTYTGTAGTVGSVAVSSTEDYNQQNELTNGSNLANVQLVSTKQNKMVCAGWDSDTHTDEHCWLWSIE